MTIALRGGTVVDGTGTDPAPGDILVKNGRIEAIGPDISIPGDAEVVDVTGSTITPGLIDAHVHLGLSVDIQDMLSHQYSVADLAAAMFENCRDTMMAGFTTVRDTGGIDGGLAGAVASGRVLGPRIIQCGAALCETGGHGHFCSSWTPINEYLDLQVPGLASLAFPVDGPEEMRKAARENFRRGADFLKLCVTGGVVSLHDSLSDTQFQVDEIRTAVEVASARGTYVTVHSHNNEGIRNAVEAGVKCIEHGTAIDAETAELMAKHDVAYVPTMAVAHILSNNVDELGLPPQIKDRVQGVEQGMAKAIGHARAAGVRVGSGSDLIGPGQINRGLELILRSAVTDPMEALVAATKVNADILRISEKVGTLETAKLADIVAWDGDPLANPGLFNNHDAAKLVLKEGTVVKSPS